MWSDTSSPGRDASNVPNASNVPDVSKAPDPDETNESETQPDHQPSQAESPSQPNGDDEDNKNNDSADDTQRISDNEAKKIRKPRPKLDFEFFKPRPRNLDNIELDPNPEQLEQENVQSEDRLWSFFLDVVANFPTLDERKAETGGMESKGSILLNDLKLHKGVF